MTDPAFDLHFVCTGNICRSPMAQLIAVDELTRTLGAQAERFRVHSSGTHGLVHHPLDETAAQALTSLDVGDPGFTARRLDAEMVSEADLVLTATRQHRSAAVSLAPRAAARTFTILEFARLSSQVELSTITGDDPVERFRALVPAAASYRGHIHVPAYEDDIDDPYGGRRSEFDACAAEIRAALRVPLSIVLAATRSV